MAGPGSDVAGFLSAAVSAGLAPGFVAAWGRGGTLRAEASGLRGLGAGPTSERVWYDLASLTKPLVTTTLVLLARRHGLRLEDGLGRFLPELAGSPWEDVTVWQCLTHTAGFPPWAPLYAWGELSREGYLRALAAVAPETPPGSEVVYSCLGFIALGLALERVGGVALHELFTREVLEPLGLGGALGFAPPLSVPVALGQRQPLVEERLCRERGMMTAPPPALEDGWSCDDGNARGLGGVAGNAGLFGTAQGVARLAQEFLPGGGTLLTPEEAALAIANLTPGMAQARGLGWQLAATPGCSAGPALPPEAFGHTGFTGTSVWVNPQEGTVFVLLSNRLHPGGRTPDLHPMRRRFHGLAARDLQGRGPGRRIVHL
ncbi:MAG: serine hydrolase domain-containing protein [Thermoanaerobaculum sp.]